MWPGWRPYESEILTMPIETVHLTAKRIAGSFQLDVSAEYRSDVVFQRGLNDHKAENTEFGPRAWLFDMGTSTLMGGSGPLCCLEHEGRREWERG